MATIGNYGAALGDTLKQSAGGIVKGFGYGLKGAALSEMPGLVAGYGAFSALRKNANSIGQAKAALAQGSAKTPVSSSAIGGNPFAQMVQQLAQINANTATAANVAKATAKAEQYKMMFEEEKSREQAQQNQALIDAIKNSGMGGGGGKAGEANAAGTSGLLTNILGNALGGMLGTVIMGALLGLRKKLASFIAQLVLSAALMFGGGAGGKLGKLGGAAWAGAKIAGKIGARFIPYVGWALLAADVAEAAVSIGGSANNSSKQNANPPMDYDAMGNPTGIASNVSENTPKGNSNSPKPSTKQTGANKTSGLLWRVPLRNSYTVTSEHDEKRGPPKYKQNYTHKGVDLAVYQGAPVVAAADGMITVNSKDDRSGNYVMMDHGKGYTTFYAHLLMSQASPGTKVTAGTVIGYVGSSGYSTGPHLHFEIRLNGTSKNPRSFIQLGKKAELTKVDRESEIPKPGNADSGESGGSSKQGNYNKQKSQSVSSLAAQVAKTAIAKLSSAVSPTSSTTPLIEMGDAGVAESYAIKRDNENNKKEVVKQLKSIKENTGVTAKAVKDNRISMSKAKFKTPDQIIAETNKRFTDSLQRQLTKTISGTLMNALYPGGYKNVSQRTASGQMYRGEQLNKLLGLTPQLTKLGTSIFGKQYGPAFGQIFSKAATGYMEVGARSVAQGIFGSMGMNSDQANILGGQILGNLAKGTQQSKVTALEQILYGISGGKVALGPETIFAKYGFATPAEGIGYMANVLGSAAMGPIDSALGTTPANMGNMDPRMRTMGAFGGYNGQYGGQPSTGTLQAATQNNPYMQLNKDGMVVLKDNVPQLTKDTADQLNLAKQAEKDAQQRFLDAEGGSEERAIAQKMVSEAQYEQQILTNRLLASRATTGSGTTIGGGAGGGGFFSGGGSLAEVGNMAIDLGKSAITQKAVQAMGIKNPYMAMLASFAVNKGLSYVGGKAFDMFAGTEMGKSVTGAFSGFGNTLSNAYGTYAPTWAGGYDAATLADLQLGQAMTANAGGTAASSSSMLGGFEFMDALPYVPALVALAKGDVGGAAGYAVGAYAGTAIGASLAEAGFAFAGPIGAVAGFVIGSLLGGLFSSKPREPDPAIWRVIRAKGNNNIANIIDLQPPRESPPEGWKNIADQLIRVAFNATKVAETETKELSPFDFIVCWIDKNNIVVSLRTGDPTSTGNDLNLGKLDSSFAAGASASKIVKHVSDAFKAAYAAKSAAIDKASKILNTKSFGSIANDLIKDLKTGTNKLDTTKEQGVFGATVAQDAIIAAGMANKRKAEESVYSGGDSGTYSTTPAMVWSMKEGKYVEAGDNPNLLMYDKNGNPIYDTNNNGIDLADIITATPSNSATTITGGNAASSSSTPVTVNTVADNSQTNNQSVNTYYSSLLSKSRNPIRDASVNAAIA